VCEATNGVITEKSRLAPKSELDLTIASAEMYLTSQTFFHNNKIVTNILRLGDVYGDELGFRNKPGLVNFYLELASDGKDIPLYGLGLQKRSIINITDACQMIVKFLDMDFPPPIINLPGENLSVVEIANRITDHYEVEGYLESPENRNDYCNRYGGNQKLSAKLLQSRIPIVTPQKLAHWLVTQSIPRLTATL